MNAYVTLRTALAPVIRAVWGARAEGPALPTGPLVVVSNHESLADPFFLGTAVERPLRFVAKQELWANRIVGRVLDALGGIPVRRGRGDLDAMAAAAEALRSGVATRIGINPVRPGRLDLCLRHRSGWRHPARPGRAGRRSAASLGAASTDGPGRRRCRR